MPSKNNYQELEAQRIKEIVRGARNSPNRQHTPWVYRGEIMGLLALALEHKQDRLILDGREFCVIYTDAGARATVRPTNGDFVPCAHIIIEKYLDEWERFDAATRVTRLPSESVEGDT